MLKFNIHEDDTLSEVVNRFISAMLPHSKYEPAVFSTVLNGVFRYIKLNEMTMEYYVFFATLYEFEKMLISFKDVDIAISKEHFEDAVAKSVLRLVQTPEVDIIPFLRTQGMEENLLIETSLQRASSALYERCMDLYDTCFDMEQASTEVLMYIPSLRESSIAHAMSVSASIEREIRDGSYRVGRRDYRGMLDALDYTHAVTTELRARSLGDSAREVVHVNNLEIITQMREATKQRYIPLAPYNIPPLDDSTSILKHRLMVLVGNEGVGKTTTMIAIADQLIAEGRRICIMTGESGNDLVLTQLQIKYIYRKFGKRVKPEHISGASADPIPDDIQKLIDLSYLELVESGSIVLVESMGYSEVYTKFLEIHRTLGVDGFFIDHSTNLRQEKGTTMTENVASLAYQLREFRRNYPVYVCVLSQLSSMAKEFTNKFRKVKGSPTAQSAALSQDADEIFVLMRDEMLSKQNLTAMQVYKRRNSMHIEDFIVLKMDPLVFTYTYDVRYQRLVNQKEIEARTQADLINSIHESEDDEEEYGLDPSEEYI